MVAVPADHVQRVRQGTRLFQAQVRELLIDNCLDCHGGNSVKADFDLSTRAALMRSGYVADTANDSHLLDLITHAAEPHMPLQAPRLPDAAIDSIRRWIDLGAPYNRPLVDQPRDNSAGSMSVTEVDRRYWAFQPLAAVAIPGVEDAEWCRTPIDHFILARQRVVGVRPNPLADPRTLVRRAMFDLHGLPATSEQVEHFATNQAEPQAWSNFVNQLLASEHYGERWARHWMDIARFAESHGYEQDYDRPHAYHYRDFLIKALNQDLPYDKFLQWQLAGDELAPDNPLALMATGFLGAGVFPTQLTEAEFESARYDELDDMVTTTGLAFLGLSVGCARCHDHKFDPIPAVDYYRFAATFTTTIRSEVELELQPQKNQQLEQAWKRELEARQAALAKFEQTELPAKFSAWLADYKPHDHTGPWQTLQLSEVESTAGTVYQPQPDGSWLASGSPAAKEVLRIRANWPAGKAYKLRLEALRDASLPRQGPGRADNGNFALGNIQLKVGSPTANVDVANADVANTLPVVFSGAAATHQQNGGTLSALASIDDDPISGWAVDQGGIGQDQAAVFEFAEPVVSSDTQVAFVELTFNHPNTKHAIGRLRLSLASDSAAPTIVGGESISAEIKSALQTAAQTGDRTSAAWQTAQNWFATTLPGWRQLQQACQKMIAEGPPRKLTKAMISSEGLPPLQHHADGRGFPHFYPQTFVLNRGDVAQKQEVAEPGFLQVLTPADRGAADWRVDPPNSSSDKSFRRASLANWMTDAEHGAGALVARVIVNRVWQHHFGRGLVATPNDFGVSGELPTHPELLEWLAHDLVEHGWQLKRLHHLIMTSSVYMQSNAHDNQRARIDRENETLWCWTPRRLEAEAVRDSMLAVSGMLDRTMFGPGTLDPNMKRRSVYFFIKRSKLIPSMMLFDWPEHLVSIGQRSSTTGAPQALMFLNSPQGRELAKAFAERIPVAENPQEMLRAAYSLALARQPTRDEASLAGRFLNQQTAIYREQGIADARTAALVDFCQMLMSTSEFIYIE